MKLPRPLPGDVAGAAGFLIVSQVAVWAGSVGPKPVLTLLPLPAAVALVWRSRRPLLVLGVGGAAIVAGAYAGILGLQNLEKGLALTLMAYAAGSHEPRRRARLGLLIALVVMAGIAPSDEEPALGPFVFGGVFFCAAPWALGRAVNRRASLLRELEDKSRELERRRAQSARLAALEERTRLAGATHGVIARSVAAMAGRAEEAEAAAVDDPARARAAAESIETIGRDALAELRELLGVLRRDGEEVAG